MSVHIVLWNDGHIIPRMAQWLADGLGWTISDRPDPRATINYYMPYLQIAKASVPVGPMSAAWFTHYEAGTLWKETVWGIAARLMNMATFTAPMYADMADTPMKATLTPGIDHDFFQPLGRPDTKQIIGISGVGQPRKGLNLVRRLVAQGIGRDVNLIASGANWPIPSSWIQWDDMPDFYNVIDVHLCTSLVEGIPAPPLEALACGRKIVIPNGVGMLDELPEMAGIRHYRRGDFDDMARALRQALDDDIDAATLRDVSKPYSVQAWVDSHEVAMSVLEQGYAVSV